MLIVMQLFLVRLILYSLTFKCWGSTAVVLLVKKVFLALFSFSKSLATECLLLNNEPLMARPTLIELNPVAHNYCPFMISLHKCNGSCYAADDLSTKICAQIETKDANVMITKINEAKTLVKHISCDCKCKFNQ